MSAFAIFALVLTLLYILYYSVLIVLDLFFKKDKQKGEVENINVSDMNEGLEEPVSISEDNDGEPGGHFSYIEQTDNDGLRVINPTGDFPIDENVPNEASEQEPAKEQASSQQLNEKHEAYMEDIQTESQQGLYSDELFDQINEKYKKREIIKTNAIDNI